MEVGEGVSGNVSKIMGIVGAVVRNWSIYGASGRAFWVAGLRR